MGEQHAQCAERSEEVKEAMNVLHSLRSMEPGDSHALVIEVLGSGMDTDVDMGTENSSPFSPQASNPLEAMLGAFLGSKGCGKGVHTSGTPASPNPLAFLGPLLAGKGSGEGCNMDAPMSNPFEAFLTELGRGSGYPECAANDGQPPHPMQLLGSLLGNSRSGMGPASTEAAMPPAAAGESSTGNRSSNHGDASRAAFEESVNDLLNMGLVTDRQTARELLTQHGDISSVVAILAGYEH